MSKDIKIPHDEIKEMCKGSVAYPHRKRLYQYVVQQEQQETYLKQLVTLFNRYLGAVSYDVDQTDYGFAIVKDFKALEEELK